MRAVYTLISRHISIITSDQALHHLEWYGIKWVANNADPAQSPRPVYTIQLFCFHCDVIRYEDFVLFAHVLNSTSGTHTHTCIYCYVCIQLYAYITNMLRIRMCDICIRIKLISACALADSITKTYLHNFDPFKPHFYIVKLGFTGVYIIFLISAQKHRLWVVVRTACKRWTPDHPSLGRFLL